MRTPNMLKRLVVLGVCVLPVSWQASIVRAQEIGYVEDFALAKDRGEALKSLIPGTDDFYYYHSLHYQHTEQFPKVEELIPQWVQKHGHNQRVNEILTRQALLLYPKDPQRALNRIRERLGVQWPHQKEVVGAKPNLPTGLDQNLFSRESFAAGAFARHGNLDGFEDSALDWLVAKPLNKDQRRHLLSRLHRPDYPQVVDLIVADMKEEGAPGFGAFAIHNLLLPEQLNALLKARPELANNHNFVNAQLVKLQPPAHVDWKNDRVEREKYLTRLWDYASKLAPVFNSLKAHVLYQRLVFDRAGGTFDRDRFMTYIQLPRRTGYANPQYLQKAEQEGRAADLNANYGGFTALGNVGNDEPLVRAYLQQFFLKDADAKAYEPFLHDGYLRRQFAETKIVNGLGNAEQWSAMLSPEEFKQLQERIDLDFAPTNREVLGVDEPVSIDLSVKNVKTLIVKVFELNTTNFYRSNLSELDTDINLDGLVANVEKTETYNEPPLRRVSRHFDFPQLSKAGVYVIDFIGNGQSSRVLVRKGKLRHLVRTSTAGHVFTVLDDQNRHLPDAKLWLAGHEYLADKEGRITVPFSAAPGRVPVVLTHGEFSSLDHFAHESENYALTAGFHVDRESLLKLQKATVMIRPSLAINGTPVSLKILEDVRLQITSTDHDGVVATKEVRDFVLLPDREASYEFQVPPRAQSIAFMLQAKVQNLSTGQKLDVVANRAFALNEIDRTDKTEDVYLGVADGAYFLDVYGRTGEALPERAIRVQLKHRDIRQPLTVMLKSNPAGRVSLGKLGAEIDWVEAASPQGVTHRWTLPRDQHTQYASVHGQVGKTIEIPFTLDCGDSSPLSVAQRPLPLQPGVAANADASAKEGGKAATEGGGAAKKSGDESPHSKLKDCVSLLERRGNSFVADRFNAIKLDGGLLKLEGLAAGEYDLWLKQTNQHINVRVLEGEPREGYVLGKTRHLEIRDEQPLQIASVTSDAKSVHLKLQNLSPLARVHVIASRYLPTYAPFDALSVVRDAEPYLLTKPAIETKYISGRNIGDEYRYIIDRKYQPKFAGNTATRPSLLLNPWAVRETQTGRQEAAAGDAFGTVGKPQDAMAKRDAAFGQQGGQGSGAQFSNVDFLGAQSVVLLNLVPNEDGTLTIPREKLGPHSYVEIIAVDAQQTASRVISLPEPEATFRDLRLASSLDVEKHFTEQKQVSVVKAGEKLTIGDVTSSKFTTYDSLSKVFALYAALNPQPQLMEFGFVLRWPTLKPEQKRELYSKYASHELNFFLFKKDPEFFASVIRPYLKNKHSKTFMDHWLLGDDVSAYRAAWSYEQLNAVERILLSQRIADDAKFARQLIGEQVAVLPPNLERVEHLYRSAVASNSLDADDDVAALTGAVAVDARYAAGSQTELFTRSKRLAAGKGALGGGMGGGGFAAGAAPAAPPAAAAPGLANRERQLAEQDRAASFAKKGAAMDEARKSVEAKDAKADGKESGLRARRQISNETLEKAKQYRGDDKSNAKGERAEAEMLAELSDFEANGRADLQRRSNARQLYRKLEATMEWAENNYYRLPIEQQNGGLVTSNAFWKDYADSQPVQNPNVDAAKNPGPPPFFSKHIAEASRNFTEMMFALAVLDLPFNAEEHKTTFDGVKMELAAGSSTVIFHQEVKAADFDANAPRTVLVNQNFFRNGDRHRTVNGEQVDKYVSDEFLTHVVYGCQVVVTNPTSTRQKLSVLVQVPQGAVPVANSHYTRSLPLDLQPYQTQTIEFHFYFPTTGEFSHYPVHVAKNEAIIAAATAKRLKVVDIPTSVDKQSWDYISQHGSNEDVLTFLATQNVLQINLEKMAFRLHEPAFFAQAIDLLSKRHIYHHALWSYAVKHNDAAAMRAYLLHADGFLNECGRAFESPLVTVDPVERKQYQHLDYTPLVNARAHQLGKRRRILNDALYQQYHRLLAILAARPRLDDADRMAVTYYLLLQDRVEEAQVFFSGVNAERLESKLQHDYFAAYFDLYNAEPERAKAIVAKYRDFPVDRWKTAFAGIASQLEEAGIKPLAGAIGPNAVASVDRAASVSVGLVPAGSRPSATATSNDAEGPSAVGGQEAGNRRDKPDGDVLAANDKGPMTNDSSTAANTALAATEPSFDFAVESKKVKLKFQNLKSVRVNYYEMDIELLFSRNPFVQQFSGEFSFIRPNETAELKLPEGKPDVEFDLPARFHNSNVLVEITAAGETKRQTYYSHALNVQTIENYGQVSVTHEKSKKPLAKTYVKVYARLGDGSVKFYKDGYTDLRGRFDYASINTGELDNVQRFSILILSEEHGAIVREATPPKR